MHDGQIVTLQSNMRWCSDVFEVGCWNGERVRIAFSMDCCDREVISYVASTAGISGEMARDLMAESIEARFGLVDRVPHKIEWLTDNGSAYTAHTLAAWKTPGWSWSNCRHGSRITMKTIRTRA